jgi:diaminohydroxyphosphoribosylaminopyrimidine deaminase/5-amino-6-(5-phosphoribosylamino)uracil reductase
MVGCIITKNNNIIAQGYHQNFGEPHAEINALTQINHQANDTTLYVTLEPCAHQGKTPK